MLPTSQPLNSGAVTLSSEAVFNLFRPEQYPGNPTESFATDADFNGVVASKPFGDLLEQIATTYGAQTTPEQAAASVEAFLRGEFPNLTVLGANMALGANNSQLLVRAVERYSSRGMEGQATSLSHIGNILSRVQKAFNLLNDRNELTPNSILPLRYMPEIITAAPVWFSARNHVPNTLDLSTMFEPVSEALATIIQLYNEATLRPISRFTGPDLIPPGIMDLIETENNAIFDHLVIATPYHNLASDAWQAGSWRQKQIDPYLLGFIRGFNYVFMLGRWSGTGILPLLVDMVAATMDHLRRHVDVIGQLKDSYFQIGNRGYNGEKLLPKVKEILKAHDERRLFAMLRGEKPATPA